MRLEDAVWKSEGRLSGALCFRGTRIPVSVLFDHLKANDVEAFYRDFPDVTYEAVLAVLDASTEALSTIIQESAA